LLDLENKKMQQLKQEIYLKVPNGQICPREIYFKIS
jgi:hypothetical protein